jgi:hypothetical protein
VTWGFQPEAFELDRPDLLIRDPRQLVEQLNFLSCSAS